MSEKGPGASMIDIESETYANIARFLRGDMLAEARKAGSPEDMRRDTKVIEDAANALDAKDASKATALLERYEEALHQYVVSFDQSRNKQGVLRTPAELGQELAGMIIKVRHAKINAMLDMLGDLKK